MTEAESLQSRLDACWSERLKDAQRWEEKYNQLQSRLDAYEKQVLPEEVEAVLSDLSNWAECENDDAISDASDLIRCLYHQQAASDKALQEVAGAKQEAIHRAQRIADEPHDTKVRDLCESIGYGAVMDSASRQWILKDSMGAFYIGGCLGHRSTIERLQEKDDE